jgi:hypothetical protein
MQLDVMLFCHLPHACGSERQMALPAAPGKSIGTIVRRNGKRLLLKKAIDRML